jgi:hypothetical protein
MKKLCAYLLIFTTLMSLINCQQISIDDDKPDGTFSIAGNVYFLSANAVKIGLCNADVKLAGNTTEYELKTDEEGNFLFKDIPSGTYSLMVNKIGISFTPSSYPVILNQKVTGRDFRGGDATGYKIDPWGDVWTANVLPSSTWDAAVTDCATKGGRLPTATEIYRNSFKEGNTLLLIRYHDSLLSFEVSKFFLISM